MPTPTDATDLLVARLADHGPAGAASGLVLAAILGAGALASELTGEASPAAPLPSAEPAAPQDEVFIGEIAVEGFRGIGPRARLGLRPSPGLTIITGRNGSGKSSFAEAAELALTGKASRWEKRSKVWEEGWACVHHDGARSIELKLSLSGEPGDTVVRRKWRAGDDLTRATTTTQSPGEKESSNEKPEWAAALTTWRPFLSYNELGGPLDDGPSRLHDAISAVLGLEEWVEAAGRLDDVRKRLDAAYKEVKIEALRLKTLALALAEERAAKAAACFGPRDVWDFQTLAELATGSDAPSAELAALEGLARLQPIDVDAAVQSASRLLQAAVAVEQLKGSESERSDELAALLEKALAVHAHTDDATCPVCGTDAVLDAEWADRTRAEVSRLKAEATGLRVARSELAGALAAARSTIKPMPAALEAEVRGVDSTGVVVLWRDFETAPDGAAELGRHLNDKALPLAEAIKILRKEVEALLVERQDLWRPLASQIAAWVGTASNAVAGAARSADLKAAATWLRNETTSVRNDRLRPIVGQVTRIWETLCSDSNVSLTNVALEGVGTRRHVQVDVAVDTVVGGAALSVMSQGELNALALAMFLPRATVAESPFRFVLIDDPVQAMDFVRVNGLGRVLSQVATDRQVIVFTHDARLPDACRRLGLAATVLEVSRSERSVVSVRRRSTPSADLVSDVKAILATDEIPPDVLGRVVPGLCRRAVEAACADVTWKRLLGNGVAHSDIGDRLEAAGKFLPRLALALFGDGERAGDVYGTLKARFGPDAVDVVVELNRGSHVASGVELLNMAERTVSLISRLERLA